MTLKVLRGIRKDASGAGIGGGGGLEHILHLINKKPYHHTIAPPRPPGFTPFPHRRHLFT